MILVVGEARDVHARVVAQRLAWRGVRHALIDAADFPQRLRMSARYTGGRLSVRMANGAEIVGEEDVDGVWLRRVRAHEISPEIADRDVASFAHHQSRDLFLGWAATLRNVMNSRSEESRAELKPFQLFAAQEVGLTIPRTLVSNDPDDIRAFDASIDGEVIFKALSPTQFQFLGTQVLEERHLDLLDSAALAPTIFQERVHAQRHLRITLVDNRTFAASIEPVQELGQLDWRLDRDARMAPFSLPADVEERLHALRRRLGLRYGAIDMILAADGRYIFLEINPGGQFLFVEIHAGLPISEAIADALLAGAAGRTP